MEQTRCHKQWITLLHDDDEINQRTNLKRNLIATKNIENIGRGTLNIFQNVGNIL